MAALHLVAGVGNVEVKYSVEQGAQVDVRNVPMNGRGHCFFVSLFNSTNIGWDIGWIITFLHCWAPSRIGKIIDEFWSLQLCDVIYPSMPI